MSEPQKHGEADVVSNRENNLMSVFKRTAFRERTGEGLVGLTVENSTHSSLFTHTHTHTMAMWCKSAS